MRRSLRVRLAKRRRASEICMTSLVGAACSSRRAQPLNVPPVTGWVEMHMRRRPARPTPAGVASCQACGWPGSRRRTASDPQIAHEGSLGDLRAIAPIIEQRTLRPREGAYDEVEE